MLKIEASVIVMEVSATKKDISVRESKATVIIIETSAISKYMNVMKLMPRGGKM